MTRQGPILITLGGGGHTEQMLRLAKQLASRAELTYVVADGDELSAQRAGTGPIQKLPQLRRTAEPIWRAIAANVLTGRWLRSFVRAWRILRDHRPRAVVTAGPNFALPLLVLGRMLGIPTVYIETWSRICTRSLSGRVFCGLVDRFYVQWPEQTRLYRRARYCGRLG